MRDGLYDMGDPFLRNLRIQMLPFFISPIR
jgi:hypothetical protein